MSGIHAPTKPSTPQPPSTANFEGKRIAIVEDNAGDATTIMQHLQKAGGNAVRFDTAQEWLRAAADVEDHWDIMLVGHMPDMSIVDALEALSRLGGEELDSWCAQLESKDPVPAVAWAPADCPREAYLAAGAVEVVPHGSWEATLAALARVLCIPMPPPRPRKLVDVQAAQQAAAELGHYATAPAVASPPPLPASRPSFQRASDIRLRRSTRKGSALFQSRAGSPALLAGADPATLAQAEMRRRRSTRKGSSVYRKPVVEDDPEEEGAALKPKGLVRHVTAPEVLRVARPSICKEPVGPHGPVLRLDCATDRFRRESKKGSGMVVPPPLPQGPGATVEPDRDSEYTAGREAKAEGEESDEEFPEISPVGGQWKHEGIWCGGYSQIGYYPNVKEHENQDRVIVEINWQDSQTHLMAVMDGHGPQGHDVAEYVRKELPLILNKNLSAASAGNIPKALKASYVEVDAKLNNTKIDSSFSGTTAVTAWVDHGKVYVANTGDSRAVLGRMEENEVVAYDLSTDQTPFREDEKARVQSWGGRVLTGGEIHGEASYDSAEEYTADDPPRCYLQDQTFPGTAFTRSIGDQVAKSIGIIAKPEVKEYRLRREDKFLILASDGIWEFISSQEAVELVKECTSPAEAAHELIMAAWDIWLTEDVRTDDISVVVAFLDAGKLSMPLTAAGQ